MEGHLPQLSAPPAGVLVPGSFGMVIWQSCGFPCVSSSLALWPGVKENSMRQRIGEWYYAKEDKRGTGRCELEVSGSFVALLRWIVSWWPANEKRLALAMEATNLGNGLVALVISGVYRGGAIPIAWRGLPVGQKGSWKEIGLEWFAPFQEIIPEDWVVIVMAERGLYANCLWEVIRTCNGHPVLRSNRRFFLRPKEGREFRALPLAVEQPGCQWSRAGTCFKVHASQATRLLRWEPGFEEPWLILTDLPAEQALPGW